MGEGDYYTTLIGSETNISLQRMDDIFRNDLQYMKQHLSIILVVNGHQSTKKSHSHQWTWYATPFYPTQVCNINKCSMAFSLSDESECKLRFTQKVFLLFAWQSDHSSLQIPLYPHIIDELLVVSYKQSNYRKRTHLMRND